MQDIKISLVIHIRNPAAYNFIPLFRKREMQPKRVMRGASKTVVSIQVGERIPEFFHRPMTGLSFNYFFVTSIPSLYLVTSTTLPNSSYSVHTPSFSPLMYFPEIFTFPLRKYSLLSPESLLSRYLLVVCNESFS